MEKILFKFLKLSWGSWRRLWGYLSPGSSLREVKNRPQGAYRILIGLYAINYGRYIKFNKWFCNKFNLKLFTISPTENYWSWFNACKFLVCLLSSLIYMMTGSITDVKFLFLQLLWFLTPWRISSISNPLSDIWLDFLNGGSAHRNVSTYTGQYNAEKRGPIHPSLEWDLKPRSPVLHRSRPTP